MNKILAGIPILAVVLACSLGQGVEQGPAPTELQSAPTSTESEVATIPPTPAYIPSECAGSALATLEPEVVLYPTAAPAPNAPLTADL